jgi:hypothetical protein
MRSVLSTSLRMTCDHLAVITPMATATTFRRSPSGLPGTPCDAHDALASAILLRRPPPPIADAKPVSGLAPSGDRSSFEDPHPSSSSILLRRPLSISPDSILLRRPLPVAPDSIPFRGPLPSRTRSSFGRPLPIQQLSTFSRRSRSAHRGSALFRGPSPLTGRDPSSVAILFRESRPLRLRSPFEDRRRRGCVPLARSTSAPVTHLLRGPLPAYGHDPLNRRSLPLITASSSVSKLAPLVTVSDPLL